MFVVPGVWWYVWPPAQLAVGQAGLDGDDGQLVLVHGLQHGIQRYVCCTQGVQRIYIVHIESSVSTLYKESSDY